MHLVILVARFDVPADATAALASAFMDDDRTATVWIEPDRKTSRLALDVAAATWDEAAAAARELVEQLAGEAAEIVSVSRPAAPDRLT